jgi:hypothetical protein
MRMIKIQIPVIILFLASCGNNEPKTEETPKIIEEVRSMNDTGIPIHILIDSIVTDGSIEAFENLETESLDFRSGEFLSTFMIMADKFNYDRACMKVYYEIIYMYETPLIEESENGIFMIDSLNSDARNMTIRYLTKANSLGNEEAGKHLKEYREKGILK